MTEANNEANNEATLVAAARAGSTAAAGELFERHWGDAWRTAYRITGRRATADDVAQDAMIRALTRLDAFDSRSSFATWLFRITVNLGLNTLRSERRRSEERLDETFEAAAGRGGEPDLAAAVAELPLERRVPVVLRYWLDCTPAEIAELLALPLGTVNSRLARGVRQLRALLEVEYA